MNENKYTKIRKNICDNEFKKYRNSIDILLSKGQICGNTSKMHEKFNRQMFYIM